MDNQNRDRVSAGREKFAEPRSWALKWVFASEAIPSTAEQEPESSNEAGAKFAEPRSWALKWDGSALSGGER